MTLGENRVGIGFNPSGDELVDQIKRASADLIDLIDQISDVGFFWQADLEDDYRAALVAERCRLRALALTAVEEAAMWAVKAATKR